MDGSDEGYPYGEFTQGLSGYYGGDSRCSTAVAVVPVGARWSPTESVQCVVYDCLFM